MTATSANALTDDGYWGSETTVELQKRLNSIAAVNSAVEGGLPLDGQIDSQLASQSSANPGLTSGWQWFLTMPPPAQKPSKIAALARDGC